MGALGYERLITNGIPRFEPIFGGDAPMTCISSLDPGDSKKILEQARERQFDEMRVKELVDFWFREYIGQPENIDDLLMGVLE